MHFSTSIDFQALAALKKYRATVQRRGRDAIDNRCGYLIGFLKQYQDGVAIVGVPGNPVHASRNAPALASNSDGVSPSNSSTAQSSSAHTSNNLVANGPRSGITTGNGGPSPASSGQGIAAANGSGNAFGGRPISYLQAPVRKQLEKLFESGKDKAVLEDVGLIKQLARLSEEQALAALKNYKEASKHRRDIHNKSAYLMGILRGYIEGTTPISKAPWEACSSGSSDDGPEASSAASTMPPSTSGTATTRMRGGRGRGPDSVADDVESNDAIPMPESNGAESSPQLPVPPTVPSLEASGPREMGGFASAPPVQLTEPSQSEEPPLPMAPMPARPSTSPVTPPDLVNHGIFLSGIGHNHSSGGLEPSQHRYDPSSSLLYLDGGGGVPDFGAHVHPSAHEQPPRHASPHQALFGHSLNANNPGGQQQPLVGPGLLGGDFLSNSGGGDRGLTLSGGGLTTAAASTVHTCGPGSPSNQALFGSGLLAGDEFDSCYSGNLGNIIPGSPSSTLGSLSGLGSNSLSGAGSRAESPLGSDAGNDTTTVTSATTTSSAGSLSLTGNPSCNGSTDLPPENFSPRSGEGRENSDSNGNALVAGMVDMLARLNLSKYVPVLAEAEVDMDALRLFGEVCFGVNFSFCVRHPGSLAKLMSKINRPLVW